jgi:hypothetical protein
MLKYEEYKEAAESTVHFKIFLENQPLQDIGFFHNEREMNYIKAKSVYPKATGPARPGEYRSEPKVCRGMWNELCVLGVIYFMPTSF